MSLFKIAKKSFDIKSIKSGTGNLKYLILLLIILLLVSDCKKTKKVESTSEIELWANVKIIDTTKLSLDTLKSDFKKGVYGFQIKSAYQDINVGDVIVGTYGEGFIRKVISKSTSQESIILTTIQGTMDDVFKNGSFNISANMTEMKLVNRSAFYYSISNINLIKNNDLSIDLISGDLKLDPNWNLNFNFNPSGIDFFEMSTSGSSWEANSQIKVSATKSASLFNATDTITEYEKTIIKWVMAGQIPVPVVVKLKISWLEEYSADVAANIISTTTVNCKGNLGIGLKYEKNIWTGFFDFKPTTTISTVLNDGNASATLKYNLKPIISVKLYGMAGPFASVGLMSELSGRVTSPTLDWDIKGDAWIKAEVGANATIMGKTVASYSGKVWETPKLTYQTPNSLELISGDGQNGIQFSNLHEPCKVRVIDNLGQPVKNVPVYFAVLVGGGSVSQAVEITDNDGIAETTWKLGSKNILTQKMTAKVRFGNLKEINNSPVIFSAITDSVITCGFSTFTDTRDGKSYNIINIGNQTWFAENFKYNSPDCRSPDGGCGFMYTYDDALKVCPKGWHLPSDEEWTTLINFLGGDSIAGGKMKEPYKSWYGPNVGATNESCFSGLGCGAFYYDGQGMLHYSKCCDFGTFLSSTIQPNTRWVYTISLLRSSGEVRRDKDLADNYYSIRYLKD